MNDHIGGTEGKEGERVGNKQQLERQLAIRVETGGWRMGGGGVCGGWGEGGREIKLLSGAEGVAM